MYVELPPRDLNPDFYSSHPTPYTLQNLGGGGGAVDRTNEPSCLDEPTRHLRPSCHVMDEGRQANK